MFVDATAFSTFICRKEKVSTIKANIGHYISLQMGTDVWERMLGYEGDEGEQQAEMKMLRGILGVSRREHLRNEENLRILHRASVDEVVCSGRLSWSAHLQRRDANNVTRRVMDLTSVDKKDKVHIWDIGKRPPTYKHYSERHLRPFR